MKVLVTGGAGFIGGNFVHHMVNKYPDYQIVNLDLLTYAGNLETLKPVEDKPNYKFVKGDIADEAFIMDLFEKEKFDVVVNFAAESHVDRFHRGSWHLCSDQRNGNPCTAGCFQKIRRKEISSGIYR